MLLVWGVVPLQKLDTLPDDLWGASDAHWGRARKNEPVNAAPEQDREARATMRLLSQ